MEMICRFQVNGTIIDNVFIDQLMPEAPGEYLKVYLYLLRHQAEQPEIGTIADALDHTEADVRRALRYWEQVGALLKSSGDTGGSPDGQQESGSGRQLRGETITPGVTPGPGVVRTRRRKAEEAGQGMAHAAGRAGRRDNRQPEEEQAAARPEEEQTAVRQAGQPEAGQQARLSGEQQSAAAMAASAAPGGASAGTSRRAARPVYSQEQVNRLSGDEDFAQLLYIAQKYMNKVFTPRECEVFAYLYDGLHMSLELLEYLVEYCVQGGHTSIRYIETVGLSWHERGLKTVEEAKACTSGFTRDSFAVMRAFGLTDRRPGDTEKEMISRWFGSYGFTRELVLEACNRTLEATHSPSFRYADTILSGWKKAGVKSLADVSALDQKRQGKRTVQPVKAKANQFHNFEQRDTDYDSIVLNQVKSWIGGK